MSSKSQTLTLFLLWSPPCVRFVPRTAISQVTGRLMQFQASHLDTATFKHNNRKQQKKERLFAQQVPFVEWGNPSQNAPADLALASLWPRLESSPLLNQRWTSMIGSDQSRCTFKLHNRKVGTQIKALPTTKRKQWWLMSTHMSHAKVIQNGHFSCWRLEE